MAGPGNILIKIGADAGQAVRELGKTDKALGSTMTTSEKMGAGLKKAALPAAAALGAIGIAAIGATKAAAEDAAAQEHLAGVMERTAGASDAQVASMEDWISSTSRATGVADDELRPAMENLLGATHDVAKSQKLMTAALDISAASGKDLETVTKAMALAQTGQTAKLEKLVPGLSKAAKESDNMNVIMGELAQTTGGAMAESTQTAAGQFKIFQNQTNELQESLGAALLPVVEALAPWLVKIADLAARNTTAIKVLVGVVAALSGAILAANAALKLHAAYTTAVTVAEKLWSAAKKVATALQWLWNAALSANPIGLVVVALAALGLALVVAYKKSSTFREIVQGALGGVMAAARGLERAFDAVRSAAVSTFNWIVNHWKLALFAFGPIGIAVYLISENFDRIRRFANAAFQAILDGIKLVTKPIKDLIELLGRIHVPKIKLPHVPSPFSLSPTRTPAGPGMLRSGSAAYAASGAGAGVTVNVYGAVDPEGTARAIRRILDSHDRRQGRKVN